MSRKPDILSRVVFGLLLLFPLSWLLAETNPGQVVWWGRDVVERSHNSGHTNGILDYDNEFLTDVVAVAGGRYEGFALRKDGTVISIGLYPNSADTPPAGLSNVVSLTVLRDSIWAIRNDGTVVRWGSDEETNGVVTGLSNVTAITSADYPGNLGGYPEHIALKNDGTLIGLRFDQQPPIEPVELPDGIVSNVVGVASIKNTPLILKDDGRVYGLACDPFRLPYKFISTEPVKIGGEELSGVAALASGGEFCLALKSNGTVVAWGNDSAAKVPAGLSNVVAIAADWSTGLALKRDGTVVAWGRNDFGESSVPAGLSNVAAIAAAGWFSLAVTTGEPPASVYRRPHGYLEMMAGQADLVFKGEVISTRAQTNAMFPAWAKTHATRFRIVSVLKGKADTKEPVLWHYTAGPQAWGGGDTPSWYQFQPGQCYLVFAAKLDKPDYLYSPPPDATNRLYEYRQLYRDCVTRTLDARPIAGVSIKEAHWLELNRLLTDARPTNALYAIQRLDAMSMSGVDSWRHTDDFKRKAVLKAILPLITISHDQVSVSAIGCFEVGGSRVNLLGELGDRSSDWMPMIRGCSGVKSESIATIAPYADALVAVANSASSTVRRVAAIAALSCSGFPVVRNSLPHWLADPKAEVRAQAVLLLPDFPGEDCERTLRERAKDASPVVRATVADAIGNGRVESLLPTLQSLFSLSPVRTNPAPWPHKGLQGDGIFAEFGADDIHASAGYAFQRFEVNRVSAFLRSNLNDPLFGTTFLCKLAEHDAGPWLKDLVGVLEERRQNIAKQAETSGVEPKTNYYRALMALSGTTYQCWNIIYEHLKGLDFPAFANGNLEHCLNELENAGSTGSREPLALYELYRMKGLNQRAAKLRKQIEPEFAAYNMTKFLDDVDAKYPGPQNK